MKWSAILVVILSLTPAAHAGEAAGFVAAVRGDAMVWRGAERLEARVGMEVQEGDRLQTGVKARMKVLFTDDAVLALGSKSEATVQRHRFRPSAERATRVTLERGKLRALVQKVVAGSRADFEVKTANAVAGVRGTEFVLVLEGEDTRLVTLSGEVVLGAEGSEPVVVAAGEGSAVAADGEAEAVAAMGAEEMKRLRAETDTDQAPEALAWNLKPQTSDRLRGATGPVERSGIEIDPAASAVKETVCPDCSADLTAEARNTYTSDNMPQDGEWGFEPAPGEWGDDIDADRGSMSPVTLRIRIHHTQGP